MEVFVLTPVKRSALNVIATILLGALGAACIFLTCLQMVFFAIGLVFFVLAYVLFTMGNKEYECSYFDGEARFARITNKSRRKRLAVYSMDEIVTIAPAGDRSVYNYENDSSMRIVDYTSRAKEHTYYDMVVNQNGEKLLIKFEPDEQYLNEVMKKYAQKVVRA